MKEITNKKWKQIMYIFENLIDTEFNICPKCDMPVKEGYVCLNCGYAMDEDDEDCVEFEKFELLTK